ncbi:MAG: hypothetical protein Q9176_000406 [Flavoplaca citrina]
MAMNQANVPSLLPGIANLTTALGDQPLSSGRSVCEQFYGTFHNGDCQAAIEKLPSRDVRVGYINDGRMGDYHLPHYTREGNCMIQVEVAGPRQPDIYPIAPNAIRDMATNLINVCSTSDDKTHMGGFITDSLANMAGWLTSPEGELDNPMPVYTAFLTVSVSTIWPGYIHPGQFDPAMATTFADAEFKTASKMPPASGMAARLRARGARLMRMAQVMSPRGMRISWWSRPPSLAKPGDVAGGALQSLGSASVLGSPALPGSEGGPAEVAEKPQDGEVGTATARRARRRRRRGMGEEGLMG